MTSVSDLSDLEAIKILKARYFRFVDTKDWSGLASLFADDAVFDIADVGGDLADGTTRLGKAEYLKLHVDILDQCTSVHQGYMPELQLTGPRTAKGIWGMNEYLDFRGAPGPLPGKGTIVRGYGHYYEEYVKEGGEWRISFQHLTRLRVDEFDSQHSPLPRR